MRLNTMRHSIRTEYLDSTIIFFLILSSGSMLSVTSAIPRCCFAVACAMKALVGNKKKVPGRFIVVMFAVPIIWTIQALVDGVFFDTWGWLAKYVSLFVATIFFVAAGSDDVEILFIRFCQVMTVMCCVSNLVFLTVFLYNFHSPNTITELSGIVRYVDSFLFYGSTNRFSFFGYRNAGFCWEPGLYMIYSNLSTIYILFLSGLRPEKKLPLASFMLFGTFSTMSITGLAIAGATLVSFVFSFKDDRMKRLSHIFALPCAGVFVFFMREFMIDKTGGVSYLQRSRDILAAFSVFMEKPLFGWSMTSNIYAIKFGYLYQWERSILKSSGSPNGIMHLLMYTGLVGFCAVTLVIAIIARRFVRRHGIPLALSFVVWTLFSCINEPITFMPLFFFLIGMGLALSVRGEIDIERHASYNAQVFRI